jgi:hypothetical protein
VTSEERLRGTISAVGVASGDRVVVGAWRESPVGAFADVMWARGDGTRVLLAPSDEVAAYVAGIYRFDAIEVVTDFEWEASASRVEVKAGPVELGLEASGGGRVPVPRPRWFTRWVEGPIARRVMGVEVYGTSPLGIEEWYQARGWRWVDAGQVRIDGVDQGAIGRVEPPLNVGFSEPPPRPSITDLAVRIRRNRS